jgi:hypothetical protein
MMMESFKGLQAEMSDKRRITSGKRAAAELHKLANAKTYDGNLVVERMRARRRVKSLTRAVRRAEQAGKKEVNRVRHSSDIGKKVTTLQKHEKKIGGLTKLRDTLANFLADTQYAFAVARDDAQAMGWGNPTQLQPPAAELSENTLRMGEEP